MAAGRRTGSHRASRTPWSAAAATRQVAWRSGLRPPHLTEGCCAARRSRERVGVQRKLRIWAGRYLPPELLGTLTALVVAWSVHAASGSMVSAAFAGALGESLGYYGCVAIREVRYHGARQRDHDRLTRRWRTGMAAVQSMLIEFGPAELVDSLLARPLLMSLMPGLLRGLTAGIVAGKLAADVVFYGITISAYELRQRYLALPRTEGR